MNIIPCIWSHGTAQLELLWQMVNGQYVFWIETALGQQGIRSIQVTLLL